MLFLIVCFLSIWHLPFQVIYSDEERKFNTDITVGLIHKDLLNLAEYNMHMAKLIDAGRNSMYMKHLFNFGWPLKHLIL